MIVVSHRGPVSYGRDEHGERTVTRGGGGLVTALTGVAGHLDELRWVAAALGEEDAAVAREQGGKSFTPDVLPDGLSLRFLEIGASEHHQFYEIISNPLLWFVQHQLWDLPYAPSITRTEREAFEQGYRVVNAAFAEAVIDELASAGSDAIVMVHDYHFYLLPKQIRDRCPDVFLHYFVHIPWPQPDAWRVLPPSMRNDILTGVLANDVVAFHTEGYARNFLLCCQELLGMAVDMKDLCVEVGDRAVRARWYPISIDADHFRQLAASTAVGEQDRALARQRRRHLVARVDRTDLSKNIIRGFQAFDLLLEDHPELREHITFLAMLQPSRQGVAEYAAYVEAIRRTVADINLRHGTADWQPIDLRLEEDMDLAVAVYKAFDVLVVNAIFDGMNLVAKEAILVNEHDGVLALSEHTGAHQELGAFAVTLHPFDLQQQADAIYAGLVMDPEERRQRREACAEIVQQNDIGKWIRVQLADLRRFRAG